MATDSSITFMDLACLLKITPDTVLEKLGGLINASYFDAVNMAGTLKQKGLIDFTSNYSEPSKIVLTDAGKKVIEEAEAKSKEPFDALDSEVLKQLAGGKRLPLELAASLNIGASVLALRIYKLYKQGYVIYELKNGGAEIMLTESGFLKIKEIQPSQAQNVSKTEGGKVNETAVSKQDIDEQVIHAINEQKKTIKTERKAQIIATIVLILILLYVLYIKGII